MSRPHILKPDESYGFSRYFELPFAIEDILLEFDYTFEKQSLALSQTQENLNLEGLQQIIRRNLNLVNLTNETARREALISPILLEACELTNSQMAIEYTISVSEQLKGNLDYYISAPNNLLII